MSVSWLANRDSGSIHASVYVAEMAPGASGPPTHVHDFDQFYFVVQGALEVEVGLEIARRRVRTRLSCCPRAFHIVSAMRAPTRPNVTSPSSLRSHRSPTRRSTRGMSP